MASFQLTAMYLGSTPVSELVMRFESFLPEVVGTAHEAKVLLRLAGLRAMQGERDEARRLYERGKAKALELGQKPIVAWASIGRKKWGCSWVIRLGPKLN